MEKVIFLANYKGGSKMSMKKTLAEIENMTKDIFCSYNLTLPVDPVVLASNVGIGVYTKRFESINGQRIRGAINRHEDSYKIFVEREDLINDQRFTVAHEIGHYFLKHLNDKNTLFSLYNNSNNSNNSEMEEEADKFARCILMGKNVITNTFNMLKNLGLNYADVIDELSGMFKVPEQEVRKRVDELELKEW